MPTRLKAVWKQFVSTPRVKQFCINLVNNSWKSWTISTSVLIDWFFGKSLTRHKFISFHLDFRFFYLCKSVATNVLFLFRQMYKQGVHTQLSMCFVRYLYIVNSMKSIHGFVLICFVVVMSSVHCYSHYWFIFRVISLANRVITPAPLEQPQLVWIRKVGRY